MSAPTLRNPYEDELPTEHFAISRVAAWSCTVLFLLIITLPTLWQDVRAWSQPAGWVPAKEFVSAVQGTGSTQTIDKRLKGFESSLEQHLEFAIPARRWAQCALLGTLHLGNEKTVLGRNGWLFYAPEIKALTSYGPLRPEPTSVAKDPTVGDWQPPLPAITAFAQQLQERGIALWIVPVPMKESIYPEQLNAAAPSPAHHADEAAFYQEISASGNAEIVRLESLFLDLKKEDATAGPVYLKQDTHWSPRAMQATARLLAARLGKGTQAYTSQSVTRQSLGDLVEKLDLADGQIPYLAETTTLDIVLDPATSQPVQADAAAPVVLLGDSFVNIFHDPSLGFGTGDAQPIGAGLAQQLMLATQAPVDVIAMNGGAASTVREQFAKRPDDVVRKKKIVIWVIAARDLNLSRGDAIANRVEWKQVTFNPAQSAAPSTIPASDIVVDATVSAISMIPADPSKTNYAEAVFCVQYHVNQVLSGTLGERDISVYHWLFKKRQFLPTAHVAVGQRYQLNLQPWASNLEAYSKTLIDDFNAIEVFYSETATPL